MGIPDINADYCKFCGGFSNSGFEVCSECFKEKIKQTKQNTIKEIVTIMKRLEEREEKFGRRWLFLRREIRKMR